MSADQTIAYISDVGAQELKPLFVAGCCVTTVSLILSFLSERWLRHRGRLEKNTTTTEKWLSGLAIVFGIIGSAGLILLSIFDTLRHPRLHDVFLLVFIAGYIISAIFICWEYQRLGIRFRNHRVLRISFWMKLFFILVEVVLAIAFISTNFKKAYNAAAVLEWAVAFIFTFYLLSFVVDLFPAVHTRGQVITPTEMQMEANDTTGNANAAYLPGRDTLDSQRTLTGGYGHGAILTNNAGGVHTKPVRGYDF